ncbi:MAG: HPP family protein [Rhodoferax sp.]|jgi:CBS domain-containing membrane protein|nr:HPP family protein [Rhodoferax sp.]
MLRHSAQAVARPVRALVAGRRDLLLGAFGVGLGLLITEAISRQLLGSTQPWFLIPMGASALLAFAVPASPLAQPWPVIGGNLVAALCGVACYHWLGDGGWAMACAGGLAVALMFALRCLHPPGGAMALTAVLGGPAVHALGWKFIWSPVLVNSLLVTGLAVAFHRLSGHAYPHHPPRTRALHDTGDPAPSRRGGILGEDIDAALASYGELLDIDRGDLEEVLTRAQVHAQRRHWSGLRCADVMSKDLVVVAPDSPPFEAWQLLAHHRIKSLPVVDAQDRLLGILSVPDFFIDRHKPDWQQRPRMADARRVADIMTTQVRTASPDQPLVDLAASFSDLGLHHLPVTDMEGRLVGMVTQSDMVAALLSRAPQASL